MDDKIDTNSPCEGLFGVLLPNIQSPLGMPFEQPFLSVQNQLGNRKISECN